MSWYPIAFFPPQFENPTGFPYTGGVLKAYAAGTSTNIPMATTYQGTTTASSFLLNSSGYPTSGGAIIIPHIQENYKLALYPSQSAADTDSGAVWTYDNIQIADSTNQAFVEYFDGNNSDTTFTLSEDMGTDEKILMVFADRPLPDYVTNGTFASDTAWTKGAGWTIGAGVATATGAISTDLTQNASSPIIQGMSYTIEFTITRAAGGVIPKIGGNSGTERTSNGTYRETIIAGSTQAITFSGNAFTGTVDTVTVKPTYAVRREVIRPDEYTLVGNQLTLGFVTPSGTKNIIVFAPSLLLGAAASAAAAAATSETNAAASAATAEAAADALNATIQFVAFRWLFDNSTTMADPGSGDFRLNNATLASVTAIAVSDVTADVGTPNIEQYLLTWDDAVNTIRGTILIRNINDPTSYVIYNITGNSTNGSGFVQFAVTYNTHTGSFTNGDTCFFQFTRAGDGGDMVKGVYDAANISQQLLGLTAAQSPTNKTFDSTNSVAIPALKVSGQLPTGVGATVATYNTFGTAGVVSTGTVTLNPLTQGPMPNYTNGGAHTLAAPASPCSMLLEIVNNGSAGTITLSGFTKTTGDALNTTNGNKFLLSIIKTANYALCNVVALQ